MKIGIVNDQPMAIEALRRVILLSLEDQVIWTAADGAEAIAKCRSALPDLVLMDIVMPGIDGVEATRRIMAETPCTILLVTSDVDANVGRVFEAMGYGALDAVDTPALGTGNVAAGAAPLVAKIAKIRRLIIGKDQSAILPDVCMAAPALQLVAFGASAGGPAALATVLRELPKDFAAAIVIVQHVNASFATGLAEWLNSQCVLQVRPAREGDEPCAGKVLIAATDDHLVLRSSRRLGYLAEPVDYVYRPSVDVLFHSIGRFWPDQIIGVVLTGMGRDGAKGLKALRGLGHHTIAQDEASSAVYGMPKAAVAANAASEVLPLRAIAAHLIQRVAEKTG